jgi:hypothetical protein
LDRRAPEELSRDRDLGHLERDIAAVADDLRADLDRLFVQARQRLVLDRIGRRECVQEITEIVGGRMMLKPDGVGGERAAGQSCPSNRAVALLD